jgi:hypothetical protein
MAEHKVNCRTAHPWPQVQGLQPRGLIRGAAFISAISAAFLFIAPARAQDEDDPDVPRPQQNIFQLTPEQFDSWVFNGQVNGKQWQPQLKSQLNLRIEAVDNVCKLTETQKQKLTLAGRYDIQRFSDKYETLKQKLQGTTYNQDQINEAYQQIQPLQEIWQAGIFGEKSLFHKVLPNVLGEEQTAKYQQEELKRRKFRYMAKVKLALTSMENSLPLTAQQRGKFEELILAETPTPKRFGQYDNQVVMLQAAKIKEAKLKEIFDAAQLKRVKTMLQQARGYEHMLKQQGWIE